jgi:putative transposase
MPCKNSLKIYTENGYYHLYNRGVEKRNIFLDEQDFQVFLHFLKRYLSAPIVTPDHIQPNWKFDLFDKLKLIAYCLMPNHFHLLIKQTTKMTIADFMRALSNSYIRYFNEKYDRVGPLFQGTYKGVLIENDSYLLHLSRYIHLNPCELLNMRDSSIHFEVKPPDRLNLVRKLEEYRYSSYADYLGKQNTKWIHTEEILTFFKTTRKTNRKECLSYQSFIEDFKENPKEILDTLAID